MSEDYPAKYYRFGDNAVFDTACISGSEICLMTTGIPNSQTNIFLSSEVETNFLLKSTKVIVFTAPRCSSYT